MNTVQQLVEQLKSGDVLARAQATSKLVPLGEQARSQLAALGQDPGSDEVVRCFALAALPRFATSRPQTRETLVELLEDDSILVVRSAFAALGALGDPDAIEAIEPYLNDSRVESRSWFPQEESVKQAAELALSQLYFAKIRHDLAHHLRQRRQARHLTQSQMASLLGSSQSRVAKMESADASVSVDLLFRSHLALGATCQELATIIHPAPR